MMSLRFLEDTFDPNSVTPGVAGFVATALVALAVIALMWDMNRRIRRSQYRFEAREAIAKEIADRDAVAASNDASDNAATSAVVATDAPSGEKRETPGQQ